MLTERLQILLEPEQRARLDAEAKRTGRPIGELVREAIDARFGGVGRGQRRRAVREMRELRPSGEFIPPEELGRMIDSEHDAGGRTAARQAKRR